MAFSFAINFRCQWQSIFFVVQTPKRQCMLPFGVKYFMRDLLRDVIHCDWPAKLLCVWSIIDVSAPLTQLPSSSRYQVLSIFSLYLCLRSMFNHLHLSCSCRSLQAQLLTMSQISSCIEYVRPIYNILMLLLHSNLTRKSGFVETFEYALSIIWDGTYFLDNPYSRLAL